ncbi:hypothetical protein V8F33_013514 [Rhypophila sp. PSN 637]
MSTTSANQAISVPITTGQVAQQPSTENQDLYGPLFAPWEHIALNPLPPMVITVKPKEREAKGLRKLGKKIAKFFRRPELPEAVLDSIRNTTFDVPVDAPRVDALGRTSLSTRFHLWLLPSRKGKGAQGSPKAGKKDRKVLSTFEEVSHQCRVAKSRYIWFIYRHTVFRFRTCGGHSDPPPPPGMSGYPSVSSDASAPVFTVTVTGVNPGKGGLRRRVGNLGVEHAYRETAEVVYLFQRPCCGAPPYAGEALCWG